MAKGHVLAFTRQLGDETILAALNMGERPTTLKLDWPAATSLLTGDHHHTREGVLHLTIPPCSGSLWLKQEK
jgi:hypothetical protein